MQEFNSLAERLRVRTKRKPSYAEEEEAMEEEEWEEELDVGGEEDDESLEVLKMEQVSCITLHSAVEMNDVVLILKSSKPKNLRILKYIKVGSKG